MDATARFATTAGVHAQPFSWPVDLAGTTRRRFLSARYVAVHSVLLVLLVAAWLVDVPISRGVNAWYNGDPPINGELHQLIISLAQYAQPIGYLIAGWLMWTLDPLGRRRLPMLVLVLVVSGLAATTLKGLVGRERPRDGNCEIIFHGPMRNLADTKTASFPSGHTATAVALSCVLAHFYPALRPLVWTLSTGVGLNRILTVRHFPSDVVAGAWIGFACACWLMNAPWAWRLAQRSQDALAVIATPWPRQFDDALSVRRLRGLLVSPWLLAAACLLMFWIGNGSYSLWDRDEPRFATATREMLARGDWIVPTFNGDLRPDKPVLIYWLQRTAYLVFGDGPFAARFWSGVGGMIACLATWRLGSRMFDARVGLVAGWMLALSPMLIIESKLGTVDAVLLACIMTSMNALWEIRAGRASLAAATLFWLALALGILTKGPVAIAVPASVIVLVTIAQRDLAWLARLRPLSGILLTTTLVAPWCWAVQSATDGRFLSMALGHHVVARSLQSLEDHSGFPGYYLVSLLAMMAPWAFLLPWAIAKHRARFLRDERILFLGSWSIAILLLFEIVRTKLVHYVLPAYPALLLLVASALVAKFPDAKLGILTLNHRWLGRAMMLVGAALAFGSAAAAHYFLPGSIGIPASVSAGVGGLGLLSAGYLYTHQHYRRAFAVQIVAGTAMIVVAATQVLPAVHREQVILDVARRLRERAEAGQTIALWLYRDPSLIYNVGRPVPIIDPMRGAAPLNDARRLAVEHGEFVCPLTPTQWTLMAQDPALQVTVDETFERWDIQGLRPRTVHLARVRPANLAQRSK
jgi:4-amino-4-deoxy-L-arabinose transferase-like glycosyltransferase/membrane-associated phospholipid phosphatase